MRHWCCWLWVVGWAPAATVTTFSVREPAGLAQSALLVEQGVPVRPMAPAEVAKLAVVDAAGTRMPALIDASSTDPRGRVRWLRVAFTSRFAAGEQKRFSLVDGSGTGAAPPFSASRQGDRITVAFANCQAVFSPPAQVRMSCGERPVLDGPLQFFLYPDARSIINAGGKTVVLAPFEPAGFRLETDGVQRATVVLRGRNPKQKSYNFTPSNNEPQLGFEVEARFHFQALTPTVRYDWRLTNQAGYKAWLERYAMALPVTPSTTLVDSASRGGGLLGDWVDFTGLGVTAPFAADMGAGVGLRLTREGLLTGGIDAPPDGGFGGKAPDIHRLFYFGMSRTFEGLLTLSSTGRAAALRPLMELPAQYYSDLGILPERGDPVTVGGFANAVSRSADYLATAQWRGTLWNGEWWREWDLGRQQGTEEASNGNSVLAPVYHFLRTGDRRFFECASRSAWYTYDIQLTHRRTGFGPMLHTRRHMLDELDWIHPRYQRAFGPILASQILLAKRERQEMVAAIRNFSTRIQAADGTPYGWDETKNAREGQETGVDTTNFIEALVACWEVTGDDWFLERARGYARWALKKWTTRTDDKFWNWNLTRYVLTGLLSLCRAEKEYFGTLPDWLWRDTLAISRHTIKHPEYAHVDGTIGGGELHYVFYHAALGAEASRLANDPTLIRPLLKIVEEQLARQTADGLFPMELGALWSQYPTRVISYYDPKAVVAYIPVLAARLRALDSAGQGR